MPAGEERIEVLFDADALARRAAEALVDAARMGGERFSICLSGGSTPRRLYRLLALSPYRDGFPWKKVHWFWGDERFVPWEDKESNYRMVREALLALAPVPPEQVHAIETKGEPSAAARAYERALKAYYGSERLDPARPLFDLTLLGLGEDGHTASLFPCSPVLDERRAWVAAVEGARPEARITLTYPALESSRKTIFLVAGSEKSAILERVLGGERTLPAVRLRPEGDVFWLVDKAARGAR